MSPPVPLVTAALTRPGPPRYQKGTMRTRWTAKGGWLFVLFSAIGLLFFASYYFDDLARMHRGTALSRFIEEMTGAYTALALVPGVAFVARRFPIARATWTIALPIALGTAVAYTILHTTLMLATRSALFPLAGLGPYEYGIMSYRYPMEGAKDAIFFAVIYGAALLFARLERGRAAEIAAAALQTELAEARLENLRLQLNPHFLFNTLNAISAVMYEDVSKADAMLAKLSDFLRIVLDSSGVQQVPLAEEVRVERMYVDIMGTRLDRRLRLSVALGGDSGSAGIPFMLLQPLLENSIRHGLRTGETALELGITAERADGRLVIDVTDNGAGYRPGSNAGHGLRNVESRLRHTFGPLSSFTIESYEGGGTRVRLAYPYVGANA